MARPTSRLTAIGAEKLKRTGRHSDGGGLYLNVSKSGSKSWVFIWARERRKREMGLGPFPAVSLAKARERAARCREQVADGLDPITERGRETRKTFGEVADAYFEAMKMDWRNSKTHYKWNRALVHHCAPIRDIHVGSIRSEDLLMVLNPLWETKSETATMVRGSIERVLDFARTRGWRHGENPARWRGHLQHVLPKPRSLTRGHLPAMDYHDVPAFIQRLRLSEAMAARALEFLILTAARSGEVLGARWSEVDLDAASWSVPAARMKAGTEHRVPLSRQAAAILRSLNDVRVSDFLFPGQRPSRPLSVMAMEMLLRRMKAENVTVHGFRSSFRDWCGDETIFPREIAEAALAHRTGDAVERAYRRRDAFEKRRHLMEAWAAFCEAKEDCNVVSLALGRQRE
jgi:integrase